MVANDPIVINQTYLQSLQKKYTDEVDDIDGMYGKVYAYGSLPGSHVDVTKPFKVNLGGANFSEATDMTGALDATRSGLAGRFKSARGQLYTMEYGIKFLLADSDATEQLGTLTADQWNYFMPTTTGT
jgi:hypothetical protein